MSGYPLQNSWSRRLTCASAALRGAVGATLFILALGRVQPGLAQAGTAKRNDTLRLGARSSEPSVDANGLLINPRWLGRSDDTVPNIERRCRFRVAVGTLESRALLVTKGPCLSSAERKIVTLNEAPSTLVMGAVCNTNSETGDVRGHVNWYPVTITGQLLWDEFSGGDPADDDVNLNLVAPDTGALTSANPRPRESKDSPVRRRSYHLEFNYSETLGLLKGWSRPWAGMENPGGSWWWALRDSLEDKEAMKRLVDGRIALVTGVFGLDGVHGFQSEIHPVLAMAVLVDTARTVDGHRREQWAVMVRDRGNEGDCGQGKLPLQLSEDEVQTFAIDLGQSM